MSSDSAAGASSAPPSPCRARKPISDASDQAMPHSSELAAKSSETADEEPAPTEQVGETAPEQQRAAEEDRVGRDHPLQALVCEKPRSVLIDGSATFTIATSRITMNCAVTIRARAIQRRLPESVVDAIN